MSRARLRLMVMAVVVVVMVLKRCSYFCLKRVIVQVSLRIMLRLAAVAD